MSEHSETALAFTLPAVDHPASTEVGVILAGLDTGRLLAGLGLASLADDATTVTLMVDQLRHGGDGRIDFDVAVRVGARRWQAVRPALVATGYSTSVSGSIRQAWERAQRVVLAADIGALGPATQAYLAACWLRRDGIDQLATEKLTEPAPTAQAQAPTQRRRIHRKADAAPQQEAMIEDHSTARTSGRLSAG
jgi:hypothetical protein